MPQHRITYVNGYDGKSSTKTFKTEQAAKEQWRLINHDMLNPLALIRYALWMDGPHIRGEQHSRFYLHTLR